MNLVGPISVIGTQGVGQENSVRPKHYKKETGSLHCESVGPIAHFGETKTLRRETESLQSHLGETEIPIGDTEVTRVLWQWLCQVNGAG